MFAGHYASAFVAKAASPTTPLWTLLFAAQFVDVLWVLAIWTGVEHVRLDPALPSNPLDLYDMPWTHSLLASLGWAAIAFVGAKRWLGLPGKGAALVAAVVVSHWVLDLVVHRPDLTLMGGDHKLGFSLWNLPTLAYLLEVVLVIGTVALAARRCAQSSEQRQQWVWLGAGLVVLQTATSFGPLPGSVTAMTLLTLSAYLLVTAAGAVVERSHNH